MSKLAHDVLHVVEVLERLDQPQTLRASSSSRGTLTLGSQAMSADSTAGRRLVQARRTAWCRWASQTTSNASPRSGDVLGTGLQDRQRDVVLGGRAVLGDEHDALAPNR
jgi:hypothetical protein